jgi:hypothetical protein
MCFTLEWIKELLINVVIIGAVIAVLRLLIPWVLEFVGISAGPIMQIINIILVAIVVIFLIVVVFQLLGCLGGFHWRGEIQQHLSLLDHWPSTTGQKLQ